MNEAAAIEAIIAQYAKHGWTLRRVLLSESLRRKIGDGGGRLFGAADLVSRDLDAAWFSRSSQQGKETWEIRSLGNSPYAIDAFLDDSMDIATRENILRSTENRLCKVTPVHSGN